MCKTICIHEYADLHIRVIATEMNIRSAPIMNELVWVEKNAIASKTVIRYGLYSISVDTEFDHLFFHRLPNELQMPHILTNIQCDLPISFIDSIGQKWYAQTYATVSLSCRIIYV